MSVLDGGVAGWPGERYSGVNVPSKTFGEWVERHDHTPHISAAELAGRQAGGEALVVLDSRPMREFQRMSIPGGIDCPGAELVYRVHDLAPDPATTVVVNCAGRTRSIIGAQSLRNAGIANPVVALEHGTMGWELAGFTLAHGESAHAPAPSPDGPCAGGAGGRAGGGALRRPEHRRRDGRWHGWPTSAAPPSCWTSAPRRSTRRATPASPATPPEASSCRPPTSTSGCSVPGSSSSTTPRWSGPP